MEKTTKSEDVCLGIAVILTRMINAAMSKLDFKTAKNYLEALLVIIHVVEKNNFFDSSKVKDFYQCLKDFSKSSIKLLKETIEELDKYNK